MRWATLVLQPLSMCVCTCGRARPCECACVRAGGLYSGGCACDVCFFFFTGRWKKSESASDLQMSWRADGSDFERAPVSRRGCSSDLERVAPCVCSRARACVRVVYGWLRMQIIWRGLSATWGLDVSGSELRCVVAVQELLCMCVRLRALAGARTCGLGACGRLRMQAIWRGVLVTWGFIGVARGLRCTALVQ